MVGVAVVTVFVVGHDDRGVEFVDQVSQELGRGLNVTVDERLGQLVLGPAPHTGVAKAQGERARETNEVGGVGQLVGAGGSHPQRIVARLGPASAVVINTELAVGAGNQHHAIALLGVVRRDAGGEEGLIVGVRVHTQQRWLKSHIARLGRGDLNDTHHEQGAGQGQVGALAPH